MQLLVWGFRRVKRREKALFILGGAVLGFLAAFQLPETVKMAEAVIHRAYSSPTFRVQPATWRTASQYRVIP